MSEAFGSLQLVQAILIVMGYGLLILLIWPLAGSLLRSAAQRFAVLALLHLASIPLFLGALFAPPVTAGTAIFTGHLNAQAYSLLPWGLYAMVAMVHLGRLLWAYVQIHASLRSHQTAPTPQALSRLLPHSVQGSNSLRIILSARVHTAAAWGVLKPAILLPVQYLSQLNEAQLKAVLLHEWMHIIRADFAWNLLLQLTNAICWFSPAHKAMYSMLVLERECAVDDAVINEVPVAEYSHTLLQCARQANAYSVLAPAFAQQPLKYRIQRMLGHQLPIAKRLSKRVLMIQMLLVCAVMLIQSVQMVQDKFTAFAQEQPQPALPKKTWVKTSVEPAVKTLSPYQNQSAKKQVRNSWQAIDKPALPPADYKVHFASYTLEKPNIKPAQKDSMQDKSFICISLPAAGTDSATARTEAPVRKVIIQIDKQTLNRARL